jgi:hypothetical protein
MIKPSRTILNPKLAWPFGQKKVKRVSKKQQQQDMLKRFGPAPF